MVLFSHINPYNLVNVMPALKLLEACGSVCITKVTNWFTGEISENMGCTLADPVCMSS